MSGSATSTGWWRHGSHDDSAAVSIVAAATGRGPTPATAAAAATAAARSREPAARGERRAVAMALPGWGMHAAKKTGGRVGPLVRGKGPSRTHAVGLVQVDGMQEQRRVVGRGQRCLPCASQSAAPPSWAGAALVETARGRARAPATAGAARQPPHPAPHCAPLRNAQGRRTPYGAAGDGRPQRRPTRHLAGGGGRRRGRHRTALPSMTGHSRQGAAPPLPPPTPSCPAARPCATGGAATRHRTAGAAAVRGARGGGVASREDGAASPAAPVPPAAPRHHSTPTHPHPPQPPPPPLPSPPRPKATAGDPP